jgi:hypothetical protein
MLGIWGLAGDRGIREIRGMEECELDIVRITGLGFF